MGSGQKDAAIIELLRERDSTPTEVRLRDGRVCVVFNVAWGYDIGDDYAHVTTNISPGLDGRVVDFFSTDQIALITDPASGAVLYEVPVAG